MHKIWKLNSCVGLKDLILGQNVFDSNPGLKISLIQSETFCPRWD